MPEELLKFETMMEWQIDRRMRIQKLLFRLHTFLVGHEEFHREHDNEWMPVRRMVDIAFSLWRSAFLTDVTSERQAMFSDMSEFINKVLTHNAITFADDHRMCELTIGYYNGNARYRLIRMQVYKESLTQIPSMRKILALSGKIDLDQQPQHELWDDYYNALFDCFADFLDDWKRNHRPNRVAPPAASTEKS